MMTRYTVTTAKPTGNEWHGPGHAASTYGLSRYHIANSIRGVRWAASHNFAWIDNDFMTTLDGVIVCNHSFGVMTKEHFAAAGVPNRPIDQLTWEQVRKLTGPNGYKIQRIETMMRTYAAEGIGVALELKGDSREGYRLISAPNIDRIVALANKHRVRLYMKADPAKPRLMHGLALARERGVWTRATGSETWQRPKKESTVDHYITRAEWGARAPRARYAFGGSDVDGIALHWPAMSTPKTSVAAVSQALRAWQRFHMDAKGWSDIAYQEAIDQEGNVYELRGLTHQSGANGNEDLNERFGALLLVLAPGETPTPAMMRSVRLRIARHRVLHGASRRIVGHGEIRPGGTQCPGPIAQRLIDRGAFEPAATNQEDDMTPEELLDALDTPRGRRILGEALIQARIDPGTGRPPSPDSKGIWTVGQMLAHDRKEADTIRAEVQED